MLRILKQYYPIRNLFFVIGEGVLIFVSIFFASWILMVSELWGLNVGLVFKILLVGIVCQTCLYYNDLYDLTVIDSYMELSIRLLQALGAASFFLALVYALFPVMIIGKGIFALSTVFVILFIISWRYIYTLVLKRGLFNQKIILVGSGELAQNILNEINEKKDCGYTVGALVQKPGNDNICTPALPCTHKTIQKTDYHGLWELSKELDISKIVVALQERRGNFPVNELLKCRVAGINIIDGNSFYEMMTGKLIVEQINPSWLIFSDGFKKSWMRRLFKRSIDILVSAVLLVLTAPAVLITAILIKLDSKGPVLYSQERVGQNGRPYMIYKFRSMVTDAETKSGPQWAQTDDDRITRVGHFIRKWRIDELPQLWNVLRGDMSFVGPRPERDFFVTQLKKQIPYFEQRFSVKPGLTGWAQINYGYGASVEDAIEKLNYDLFYIKNMSFSLDVVTIFRTVKTVIFGHGR